MRSKTLLAALIAGALGAPAAVLACSDQSSAQSSGNDQSAQTPSDSQSEQSSSTPSDQYAQNDSDNTLSNTPGDPSSSPYSSTGHDGMRNASNT